MGRTDGHTALLELKGHTNGITSVSFSSDGSPDRDRQLGPNSTQVWDARSGTPLLELKGHTNGISSASFSPDETRIVTGSADGTAKVWDAHTGTSLFELNGHQDQVCSVSFSPDGTRIVTGSWDRTARGVGHADRGGSKVELKGHTAEMTGNVVQSGRDADRHRQFRLHGASVGRTDGHAPARTERAHEWDLERVVQPGRRADRHRQFRLHGDSAGTHRQACPGST